MLTLIIVPLSHDNIQSVIMRVMTKEEEARLIPEGSE